MTDAEISKALALAIGYASHEVSPMSKQIDDRIRCAVVRRNFGDYVEFRKLDYRAPDVIWPIAVKYHKMPAQEFRHGRYYGEWYCAMPSSMGTTIIRAETPEKAVALAVIAMHKEQ